MLKLNLGCGDQTPDGWINVDYALGAWLIKIPLFSLINQKLKLFKFRWKDGIFIHDLRKTFPWQNNSVDVIYSSHTLEHLSKTEGQHFLTECHRVLKPNGIIRIIVPDLKSIVNRYLDNKIAAEELLDELSVGYDSAEDGIIKKIIAPLIRFPHKCMYDSPALLRVMSDLGYQVAEKQYVESEIDDIRTIEDINRTVEAVIIEGRKA